MKKIIYKIIILIILSLLNIEVLGLVNVGNIVLYGRGQGSLATHWCTTNNIKSSSGVNIFFPKNDESQVETYNIIRNYPMIIYMPGRGNKEYSYIDFGLSNENIDLLDASSLKIELRISVPKVEDLIDGGYTCESIGLPCTNIRDFDFSKNESEWLDKVDIKFYLVSNLIDTNQYYYNEEERDYYRIKIPIGPFTTKWNEYVGEIKFEDYYEGLPYTDLLIRNYGLMPVNIHIGNAIFLKSRIIPLIVDGSPPNGYSSYSWLMNGNESMKKDIQVVLLDDPEKKVALFYSAQNKVDYAYYVHNLVDTYGPPEGISFKIRAYYVNNYKLKVDNIKEFNLTKEFVIDRNCKIPNEEEIEILIDIRSLVYADSFHMMTNDIIGFIVQANTDPSHVKENLKSLGKDIGEIEDETSRIYFYSLDLHNTYPTDLSKYTVVKYNPNIDKECDISVHNHKDWEGKSYQWPAVVDSVDKYYKQIVNKIDDSPLNDENDISCRVDNII